MPTLTPTFDAGAMTMPAPMTTVLPDRTMTRDLLRTAQERLGGMNAEFVFGQVSMILQHERCGTHLYRSVAGRTHNPMLQRKYEEFGRETEHHVELVEELIGAMGGVPFYVSPAARALEKSDAGLLESTFLAAGSYDVMTAEATMLNAVFIAESVDHANWAYLSKVCKELPRGEMRDVMERITSEVEEQEDHHLEWARDMRDRMTMMQTKSQMTTKVAMKAEEMVAQVKSWFA
jgi:rubrerythrin